MVKTAHHTKPYESDSALRGSRESPKERRHETVQWYRVCRETKHSPGAAEARYRLLLLGSSSVVNILLCPEPCGWVVTTTAQPPTRRL